MAAASHDQLLGSNAPAAAAHFFNGVIHSGRRPSAAELVLEIARFAGQEAAWALPAIVAGYGHAPGVVRADRDYCRSLLERDDLIQALRRPPIADTEAQSTIDELIRKSRIYQQSAAFQEMIDFIGRFRAYSPYNNMLVRLQNPTCSFYATEKDWGRRFRRRLKDDARPMLILAPRHPVLLVYGLDQTEGEPPPEELLEFSKFEGDFQNTWMEHMLANARSHRIDVAFKPLSSTLSGYAEPVWGASEWKMRVVVHDALNPPSRLGVLSHELAHILLGHLGSDWDQWWPARANIDQAAREIEAEAVAFVVAERFGLRSTSDAYVSRHLPNGKVPPAVSMDLITKTAALIERMARERLPVPKPRPLPARKVEKGR